MRQSVFFANSGTASALEISPLFDKKHSSSAAKCPADAVAIPAPRNVCSAGQASDGDPIAAAEVLCDIQGVFAERQIDFSDVAD